jgi:iron(III) transport system substrate-binding protein
LALLKNAPHPNAARVLMEYCLGQKMQQSFADLGLLPVRADTVSQADASLAELEKSKLLGTTDATQMDKMLALAREMFP